MKNKLVYIVLSSIIIVEFVILMCFVNKKERCRIIQYKDNGKERYYYYLNEKNEEVKHGSFYSRYELLNYKDGRLDGISIEGISPEAYYVTQFDNGIPVRVTSIDMAGNIFADLTLKDGKPYNGRYWERAVGLRGTKSSVLVDYVNGKETNVQEDYLCDLAEDVRNLITKLKAEYQKYRKE